VDGDAVRSWSVRTCGLRRRGDSPRLATAVPTPDEGLESYLETLYVAPSEWGRGIGRALLGAIAARLREHGIGNMVFRTLRLGEARGFYESLGARIVPKGIERDANTFDDVVYVFEDLNGLIERASVPRGTTNDEPSDSD
jgi:GNAT superfamily N-acetyltransferase